ncbi:uncharacterized protein (TIGR00369 family) [Halohasta litchfieldiae]|jgi:uncharacterized protein (TIGR00369 family)|uniref:Uncharacterized domain 1-containing protein n=1 Tax=Halohasta litchfieldiae TaxID=1073996 RepID=A0A1H6TRU3_9EURY|nr:PaaI family thioesterase [Halohasta litchfieldiae]ATW88867.1 uncharacterized protein (TIGR00369 family) [Halohasta litchfieldiae]SEI79947.1 uncharacterized domain 1-containing protein [Halohasta litchfieldiae]
MSEGIPAAAVDQLRTAIEDEHGYLSWLGTTVDTVETGRIVLSVPYDEKLTNTTEPPTVHGGIAATLADTAGALVQRTVFEDPETGGIATINLNINYLARVTNELTATAEVVRAGGSVGVSEMHIESPTDDGGTETVAVGQGSFRLYRDGRPSEFHTGE